MRICDEFARWYVLQQAMMGRHCSPTILRQLSCCCCCCCCASSYHYKGQIEVEYVTSMEDTPWHPWSQVFSSWVWYFWQGKFHLQSRHARGTRNARAPFAGLLCHLRRAFSNLAIKLETAQHTDTTSAINLKHACSQAMEHGNSNAHGLYTKLHPPIATAQQRDCRLSTIAQCA